jgi:hypothetical protein
MGSESEPPAGWSAPCENCGALTIIDGDGKGVPPQQEWWFSSPKCFVCRSPLYFEETVETLAEREGRLMRMAAEWARTKITEQIQEQLERIGTAWQRGE